MRGALLGSLALIVLYTLVQENTANKAPALAGVVATFAQRLLSPNVAGLPDFRVRSGLASPYGSPGSLSGSAGHASSQPFK